MARETELLKYIDPQALGIEVAPYFNPALPKSKGYQTLILDVFDTEQLRVYAAEDPLIAAERIGEIEPVDIVGDASSIGDMVQARGLSGQIGHIVSSHNFEHLPNPIKFLQGCSSALQQGGRLSMAVPDCRACFDFFRAPTRLSDWLGAYYRGASQPSPEQVFDLDANKSLYFVGDARNPGCNIAIDDPEHFHLIGDLRKAFDAYRAALDAPGPYRDTHCTVMFNHTLELMLRDLRFLGLIDLEIVEISAPMGHEFFVHLRKGDPVGEVNAEEHQALRETLLRQISEELGASPYRTRPPIRQKRKFAPKTAEAAKNLSRTILGEKTFTRLREANRRRLAKLKQM